jgi:UDP-N-acetylmuramoylalanine--D-glutamate ligase
LSVLADRDLLPSAERVARDLENIVHKGGAVDGVTCLPEVTTDGLELSESLRMLESIRERIAPSPLERDESLLVGVLGYGEAGRAVTALLTNNGHRVRISDEKPVKLTPGAVMADVESGQHTIEFLKTCDMIVSSPGMRPDTPIFETLHRRGIPVMSELELAYQINLRKERKIPIVGVTGTIGKRTTVELIQRLFNSAGEPLVIGGNKGKPLSDLLLDESLHNPVALAVSSFQLESIVHFRPDVAVLLNVDEAHLDRHKSVPEYTRIKSRIFMNHRPDDALILPFDDRRLRALARKHHGQTFFISALHEVPRGAWLDNGSIRTNLYGAVDTIAPAESPFIENLLAAVLTARLCGLKTDQISRALESIRKGAAPRSPDTNVLAAS